MMILIAELYPKQIWLADNLKRATKRAIKLAKTLEGRPSFRLFENQKYIGKLYREFGMDFDPKNCWKLED